MWAVGAVSLVAAGTGSGAAGARPEARASAPPPAVFAKTVRLERVSGKVLIQVPGAGVGFVPLTAPREVPVGTAVDTTTGRVRLTSATPPPTTFQTGEFFHGIFLVHQGVYQQGRTDLVIRDNLPPSTCGLGAVHESAAKRLSKRILGLLRGVATGRFRTVGRFAAATVRGTAWGVRDRCDGTLTVVYTGEVAVRDFRLNRNITVRAGQTYLAKAS